MGAVYFRGSPYCSATILYTSVKLHSLSNLIVDVNNIFMFKEYRYDIEFVVFPFIYGRGQQLRGMTYRSTGSSQS